MEFKNILEKYILLLLTFILISCQNDSYEPIEQESIFPYKKHTVILYAIADNDLYAYAEKNIQNIENKWDNNFDGNFVVALDIPSYVHNKRPSVFKIEEEKNVEIIPYNIDFQSTNPKTMKSVLEKIKRQFPSEIYTLILWSHGTGWLPQNFYLQQDSNIPSKSFGKEKHVEMSIFDLKEALPDKGFETIIFDACFMASVEVLYELRQKSNYFIASSAEILQTGFPYEKLTPLFFAENSQKKWAETFYSFYNEKKGVYRSATISVTDNRFFDELANSVGKIEFPDHFSIEKNQIQSFDRTKKPIFYDFYDFFSHFDTEQNIKNSLEKLILYKANTPIFAKKFTIKTHSGLTSFIFLENKTTQELQEYYKKYAWSFFL